MSSKTAMSAVAVFLVVTLTTCSAQLSPMLYFEPTDGDCCKTYHYRSKIPFLDGIVQSISHPPCRNEYVTNSYGKCVDPESVDADRCFDQDTFSQSTVDKICAARPSAVIADPSSCSSYFNCSSSASDKRMHCQENFFYDDILRTCRPGSTVYCGQRPATFTPEIIEEACQHNRQRTIIDYNSCDTYYNCSSHDSFYNPSECTYPNVLNTETKKCESYHNVACGFRKVVTNPCELRQNQYRSSHSMPCEMTHPDCTYLADGDQPIPNMLYTPRYVKCIDGRSLGVHDCQWGHTGRGLMPRLFDAHSKTCKSILIIPRSLGGLGDD